MPFQHQKKLIWHPPSPNFFIFRRQFTLCGNSLNPKFEHHSCTSFWDIAIRNMARNVKKWAWPVPNSPLPHFTFWLVISYPYMGISIKICTRMYLYVDISKIAVSSLYLQPVICYGTAKSLIMCFRGHEIYIIFIGNISMEAIQIQQWFFFHIIFTCYSTFRQNVVMVSCLRLKLEPSKVVVFSKEL